MNQTDIKLAAAPPGDASPSHTEPRRRSRTCAELAGHQPRFVRRCGSGSHLVSWRRVESLHHCHGSDMHAGWRLSDLSRSLRKHNPAPHDDGALDDHCHRRCARHSRNFYRSRHHAFCPRGRDSGGLDGRSRPPSDSTLDRPAAEHRNCPPAGRMEGRWHP